MNSLLTGDVCSIAHLTGRDFVFVKQDVSKYISLTGPLHFIFHFASPASPIDFLRVPIQTLKVGSLCTHNALGLAKTKNTRFLLASTSGVYSDLLGHSQLVAYGGTVHPVRPPAAYAQPNAFS